MILLAAAQVSSAEVERRVLKIPVPEVPGQYLVTGTLSFNPGALDSTDRVRVLIIPGTQTAAVTVLASDRWPDGSIMSAEIAFAATDADIARGRYAVEWGGEKRASAGPVHTSLPRLTFELGGEPEVPDTTLPVGTLVVKVRREPRIYYYWYLIPMCAIIGILLWRKARMR